MPNLSSMAKFKPELLPTPNASDQYHANNASSHDLKKGYLRGVAQMLPTPTALDKGSGRINKSRSPNATERPTLALAARMGLLITPSATDGMRANFTMDALKAHRKKNAQKSNLAEQIAHKVGGGTSQLNPLFVAEMMGFPLMWTVLPFLSQNGGAKR